MTALSLHCTCCATPVEGERIYCPDCETSGRWPTQRNVAQAYDLNQPYWLAKYAARQLPAGRNQLCMPDGSFADDTERNRRIRDYHNGTDLRTANVAPQNKAIAN